MKPIIFNTKMVRAIFEGRKGCTRRVIKLPQITNPSVLSITPCGQQMSLEVDDPNYYFMINTPSWSFEASVFAPYMPGDILYVRETWNYGYIESSDAEHSCESWFEPVSIHASETSYIKALSQYFYRADDLDWFSDLQMRWRPSIHMPKEAARLFLKVTSVRVERLQDITEADVVNEGFTGSREEFGTQLCDCTIAPNKQQYFSWSANPYVWVIEFEKVEKPQIQARQTHRW